jgi:hypothetical protein
MADTYTFKGCQFEISFEDGWYYVNYVGWMGNHYVGKARSWGAATGMARHYAVSQV